MSEWKSIDHDGFPEEAMDVLVTCQYRWAPLSNKKHFSDIHHALYTNYPNELGFFQFKFTIKNTDVLFPATHWMPLPKPPNEESKGQ